MEKQELEILLNQYDEAYFHHTPLVDDQTYNSLVDQYELLYGTYKPNSLKSLTTDTTGNKSPFSTGAEPPFSTGAEPPFSTGAEPPFSTHQKCKLPYYSPSLDKIKLESKFNLFKEQHKPPFVIMDKLDGCSIIIHYDQPIKIYTHSTNGHYGFDISHLLPYFNIPKNLDNMTIRGELVINRQVFNEKYKDDYENERNIISVINAKKTDKSHIIKDFSFVAFEIQFSKENILQQLIQLKEYGFEVVDYIVDDLNFLTLTEELKTPKKYLRDGKVIASLDIENVIDLPDEMGTVLPKHKMAFKTIGEVIESKVIQVEWNISMHMKLKPRVNIEEIFLEGAHVNWVDGMNAKFILNNNIGPGTLLLISKDIIPKIYQVLEPTIASLPDEYEWDKTHTNIIGVVSDMVNIKRIYRFFDLLEAKHLGLKTIQKLYCKFKSIQALLDADLNALMIPGIKNKSAQRILDSIIKCQENITLVKVMTASCLFPNFAEKKLQQIVNFIPTMPKMMLDLLENNLTIQDFQHVPGVKESATVFIDNIDAFKCFLNETPTVKNKLLNQLNPDIDMIEIVNDDEEDTITTPPLIISEENNILNGMVIVFSGDKKCGPIAKRLGAIVDPDVTKNTTLLVVKQVGTMNTKEKRCIKDKIPIMSLNDFKEKYITI